MHVLNFVDTSYVRMCELNVIRYQTALGWSFGGLRTELQLSPAICRAMIAASYLIMPHTRYWPLSLAKCLHDLDTLDSLST
jgi:hypothetical protein